MKKNIYMDHGATTPVLPEVKEAMEPYFSKEYGNPSAMYSFGHHIKDVIEHARWVIANTLGAKPGEIFFTSGGTESDNWAIHEIAMARAGLGGHIIVSPLEHHAVLETVEHLKEEGFEISYIPVDEKGNLNIQWMKEEIHKDTILVSVMTANNEIGNIFPISRIGALCRTSHVPIHTDAVQAYGHIPLQVDALNVDYLSASAHKFGGPKGVGFLYIRSGMEISPYIYGGGQEKRKRSGTENVPGIVGMAKAAQLASQRMQKEWKRETILRNYMKDRILNEIPNTHINGEEVYRLPNNLNISFSGVDGRNLVLLLDKRGICVSTGSACNAKGAKPSHVLMAISKDEAVARSSVRFTLGEDNTREEVDLVVDALKKILLEIKNS